MSEESWTNVVVDSQVLSAFMGCPREMNFRFNEHLVPKYAKAAHFSKGTLAHKGLEVFYSLMKDGLDWNARRAGALQEMRKLAPTLDLDSEHILDVYRTFEEYCEFRKGDVFHVSFTEFLFRFKAYEDPRLRLRIYLTGRIDLGILEGTSTIPIDHKTESESWFYSSLSNQFKIYALATKSQKLIVNRFGFQKTVKPEKKFNRETISFDLDYLEEFRTEVLPYYAKQLLIAQEDNYYPPNYAHCVKGHFACVFSDKHAGICNMPRNLREDKKKLHFYEKEWLIHQDEA